MAQDFSRLLSQPNRLLGLVVVKSLRRAIVVVVAVGKTHQSLRKQKAIMGECS